MNSVCKGFVGLAAVCAIAACSNSSSSRGTGTAVFFHNVTDAALLRLEGEDRGFGDIGFENFGGGISLTNTTYSLDIFDPVDLNDGDDDVLILGNQTFSVSRNDRHIHAIVGTYDNPQLLTLEIAEDVNDTSTDDDLEDNIYINVSHINPKITGALEVYFLSETETNGTVNFDDLAPDMTLTFGQTSPDIILEDDDQTLIVRSNNETIFDSGERVITDNLRQTILLGAGGSDNVLTAFYYFGSTSQIWREQQNTSTGYFRLINLLLENDTTDTGAGDDGNLTDELLELNNIVAESFSGDLENIAVADSLAFGESSDYIVLPAGSYQVSFGSGLDNNLNVEVDAGVFKSLYLYGRVESGSLTEDGSPLEYNDDKRELANQAQLSFINIGYEEDSADRRDFNIHLANPGAGPSSSTVEVANLGFLANADLSVDDATYDIYVTTPNNATTYATDNSVSLDSGQISQYVIVEDQNTPDSFLYRLIDVTADVPQGNGSVSTCAADATSVEVSDTSDADSANHTINNITITVDVKRTVTNSDGTSATENVTTGGDTVILSTTGENAKVSSVTDNNDGTYTATIYNATAETVTLTCRVNNSAIDPTIDLTFTAP